VKRLTVVASTAGAAIALIAGCGGGSSTVVQKAGSPVVYLPASGIEGRYVEPPEYSFYVDGALIGKGLEWNVWGSSVTRGVGTLDERAPEAQGADERVTHPGFLLASGIEACRGKRYYTEISAHPTGGSFPVPRNPTQLLTPCRTAADVEREGLTLSESIPEPRRDEAESAPPPTDNRAFFQTPSRNIGCGVNPEGVRCDISEKEWVPPPKPANCPVDYGNGLTLPSEGPAQVECAGDTILGIGPTLGYGRSMRRGDFKCTSRESGVVCVHLGTSHDFFLSRQRAHWR
jgi:Family of unknown function (DUF6636)